MTLKELVFNPEHYVSLHSIDDGDAIYHVCEFSTMLGENTLLTFRVPKDDLRGAVFQRQDSPKLFMRWIRKELERKATEDEMIRKAREDWQREQQETHEATLASNRSD